MTRRLPRLGLRGRLVLAVVLGIGAVLAALTAGFNVVLARRLDADAASVLRARASAELSALATVDGRLTVPEAPDEAAPDGRVWVFADGRPLERPQGEQPSDRLAAAALATGPRRFREVAATDTRLYAVPVVARGRRLGAVVAGVSMSPYERSASTALVGSVVLAGLVLLAVGLAASWLVSGALRPVARMTARAADWSHRHLDRRFALGEPRDEITNLAATLDGLLDRIAAALRREERFSGEVSHELRTPLANITTQAQLALRRDREPAAYRATLEEILGSARHATRILETLVTATRAELAPRRASADAHQSALSAIQSAAAVAQARKVDVAVDTPPSPVRVGTDAEVVERILGPLIDNACRYARSTVRIGVARDGGSVSYTVADDGPGVAAGEREAIFEPGRRGAAADGAPGAAEGAGLGLALSRRLARAAGGEVEARPGAGGGRFVARLPAG